ncbi:MAG: phosphoribosylformylglycinamidine synthase subunit PurL [Planctomycetota bacterium]
MSTLPDAWRVEVFRRADRDDPRGAEARATLAEAGLHPASVRVGRGVLLAPSLSPEAVDELVERFLLDPVLDEARITPPGTAPEPVEATRLLVAPKPGVMDPVARTIEALLERNGVEPATGGLNVATFTAYEVSRDVEPAELARAAARTLANPTIEDVRVDDEALSYGVALAPGVRGRVETRLAGLDDDALVTLSANGQLSLNLVEMRAIQAHFAELGREPSTVELETIAQTWSEHCKHKTLTGVIEFTHAGRTETVDNLLKSTIAAATHELDREWCLSVFVDNAGIVEFDQGQALAIKVETHNHPSAIDPYGGAGTGIGGVVRDILGAGLGAKPVANIDAFFVGPPDLAPERVPKGSMHPKRILRGVVAGVRDYGNRMGIPTVAGGVWFDEGFVANPLVYAGTVGILPSHMAQKSVAPGDWIVSLGGRTGKDGIHGATFSSIELSEHSEVNAASAVQIGDPLTEKRVLDALLQARDRGLYRGVTDCGAGGYSSAVGEMGEHTGAEVDLARVPLKYAGLSSDEIWISEAQERMVLAVPPENVDELVALCESEDVEASVLGQFTDTGRLVVKDGDEVLCDMAMSFLHDGTPRPVRHGRWDAPQLDDPGAPAAADVGATLLALLGDPNVASKQWIIRQYDHEVQGTSVVKPLVGERSDGPSDGAVLRPLATSKKGFAIGIGANPWQGALDPYAMALASIDEALRNAVAVGADPDQVSVLDNFSWGNADLEEELGALVLAAKACQDAALAYRTPFVSGKDSLNNTYRVGERLLSIPRTLLITALGIVPDVARAMTMDLKGAGHALYLVGATRAELGASRYLATLDLGAGVVGGRVPRPDLATAPGCLARVHAAIRAGLCRSVHDLAEGGLAVAAAEMAFAGGLGLDLDLAPIELTATAGYDSDATRLFSESTTRFLVEVTQENAARFETELAGDATRVGTVRADRRFTIHGTRGDLLADLALDELRASFFGAYQG